MYCTYYLLTFFSIFFSFLFPSLHSRIIFCAVFLSIFFFPFDRPCECQQQIFSAISHKGKKKVNIFCLVLSPTLVPLRVWKNNLNIIMTIATTCFFAVPCLFSTRKIWRLAREEKWPPKLFSFFERKEENKKSIWLFLLFSDAGILQIVLTHLE
jgi:hypothetical protein